MYISKYLIDKGLLIDILEFHVLKFLFVESRAWMISRRDSLCRESPIGNKRWMM